jgi:hypothetical protein
MKVAGGRSRPLFKLVTGSEVDQLLGREAVYRDRVQCADANDPGSERVDGQEDVSWAAARGTTSTLASTHACLPVNATILDGAG